MNYDVYCYNQRHLQITELTEVLPSVVPAITFADYKNAFLTPTNHLFVNWKYKPAGLVNHFNAKGLSKKQQWYLFLKSRFFINVNHLKGNFFWVHDLFSGNYYHWMCEVLPRIFLLQNEYHLGKVVLPSELQHVSFVTESLDILKITPVWINQHESHLADNLITTITTPNIGDIIPELQRSLVADLLKGIGINKHREGTRKIYLSRKKANARKILNEEKLLPLVKEMGYEIIFAEDLTFREQLITFSNCKSLIALHGAGHTNLMFMPADSKVLEIKNPDWKSQPLCFFQLANIFKIKWDYLSGMPPDEKLKNNNDLEINEKEFQNKVLDFEKL
jgi:capsular polysaccharide biosynthesis protein